MTRGVTGLLVRLRTGDKSALAELVNTLHDELHRIASRQMRAERPGHTLQATALVHEAYLKLAGDDGPEFADKAHFLAVASRVMRQVLVDYARGRNRKKRSGGVQQEWTANLDIEAGGKGEQVELLDLDRALEQLAGEDAALVQIVEMKYFGGMTAEEIAAVLGQSVHVVRHDLRLAHAWLCRKLKG
jgi:RNA polymerase sigma-70 factor (ECF subfamily)